MWWFEDLVVKQVPSGTYCRSISSRPKNHLLHIEVLKWCSKGEGVWSEPPKTKSS